jgi:UDP-glucuronate 4-epimerase
MPNTVLVTGAAGFIGYHLSARLLAEGWHVVGLDSVNDYYDVNLKEGRLQQLLAQPNFEFHRVALEDAAAVNHIFAKHQFHTVINLAAQAGVRYSLQNPRAYIDANVVGFLNILEACRHHEIGHLIYASSSSVYGANTKMPFATTDNVNHPVSLYAATKKSNELMAHTYSHLFGLPTTGLRFFTVYGPWGRPDMAYFSFAKAILAGETIKVFNNGKMRRDFTYIDDIIEGIVRLLLRPARPNPAWSGETPDPGTSYAPYKIYNIGNHQPVELMEFIRALEEKLGVEAKKEFLPMQAGDVPATYADVQDLMDDVGFRPQTPLSDGIGKFIAWYREFYTSGD